MNRTRLRAQLLKHEGLRLHPYTDTVGKLTIGIGRNLTDRGVSEDEAMTMLDNDINAVWQEVHQAIGCFGSLDETRQHVVLDMAFNLGVPRLLKFRKFLAALESHKWCVAADEMLDSQWAKQVGKRAQTLAAMMRG